MGKKAKRMIHCVNCGSIIEEDCDFCYFCGQDPQEVSDGGDMPVAEEVLTEAREYQQEDFDYAVHGLNPVYQLDGARGRRMVVYKNKAVIKTGVTLGSIVTHNATDGEKTIYFRDVIGIQYKKPGLTLGYLQLETASAKGNNNASNFFDENTFTYDHGQDIHEVYQYIISRMDEIKGS